MPVSRTRPNRKKYNPSRNQVMSKSTPARQNQPEYSTSVSRTQFKGQIFQSNYPPPEMMEHYAQIDPQFPNRLLSMAEKEGDHRRAQEKKVLNWSIALDLVGMFLAPLSVAGILYTGYLFMKNGFSTEAAYIICACTIGLAVAFITRGKRRSVKEQ